jgi:hypothetical protein
MIAFFKSIVVIAKAVPLVYKMINDFYNFWIDSQIEIIDRQKTTYEIKRSALMTAIKNAQTREERIALSITLNDLNNRI